MLECLTANGFSFCLFFTLDGQIRGRLRPTGWCGGGGGGGGAGPTPIILHTLSHCLHMEDPTGRPSWLRCVRDNIDLHFKCGIAAQDLQYGQNHILPACISLTTREVRSLLCVF